MMVKKSLRPPSQWLRHTAYSEMHGRTHSPKCKGNVPGTINRILLVAVPPTMIYESSPYTPLGKSGEATQGQRKRIHRMDPDEYLVRHIRRELHHIYINRILLQWHLLRVSLVCGEHGHRSISPFWVRACMEFTMLKSLEEMIVRAVSTWI